MSFGLVRASMLVRVSTEDHQPVKRQWLAVQLVRINGDEISDSVIICNGAFCLFEMHWNWIKLMTQFSTRRRTACGIASYWDPFHRHRPKTNVHQAAIRTCSTLSTEFQFTSWVVPRDEISAFSHRIIMSIRGMLLLWQPGYHVTILNWPFCFLWELCCIAQRSSLPISFDNAGHLNSIRLQLQCCCCDFSFVLLLAWPIWIPNVDTNDWSAVTFPYVLMCKIQYAS